VQEGDTVLFRHGNYGTFTESSIARANWVTYKADTGHTPVLTQISIRNGNQNSYLIFDGFEIADGVGIQYILKLKLLNCKIHRQPLSLGGYFAPYFQDGAYGVGITSGVNITIQGCEIYECYRGIRSVTNDSNLIIADSIIHHVSEDGFSVPSCNGLTISGNTIYDLRRFTTTMYIPGTLNGTFAVGDTVTMPPDAVGIVASVGSNYVNVYATTGPNTFWHYWWADKNRILTGPTGTISSIKDVDPPHCDGFQIHGSATNILIENNYINRERVVGPGSEDGQGIKLAGGASNIVLRNNLSVAGTPLYIEPATGIEIYNNTLVGIGHPVYGAEVRIFDGVEIDYMFNNIISRLNHGNAWIKNHGNNIFHYNSTGGLAHPFAVNQTEIAGMSIANMDAMFVSAHAPSFDYRLVVGSVARDFGNPAYAPATDIAGNPRDSLPDAGCYEYNNQSPVLQSIGDKSVNEGTLLTFTLSASDPDGDAITYSAQNLPTGATLSGATFSWTPSYAQAGTYQVTFMASDGPAQDSETITIRVVNINRPPVLAPIGDKSVGEGAILNFTVSANDADGDPVTYSVQNLPGGASFASQRFSWTPAYNQAGTHQVTFTVSDGLAQDSETITIAVGNVNRAPVLDAIGDRSVFANELLTFSVQATDADNGQIQYSAQGLPSGATFTSQIFNWTPTPSQAGGYSVTFIASDGQSQDSEAIAITVHAEDKSPPSVTNCSPAANAIQAPLNSLIRLHVVDTAKGVDANSVIIKVNNGTVYTGNTTHYSSPTGDCRRIGTKADYTFSYQPSEIFDFEQQVTVAVNATDLGGNLMNEYSYSFWTEMRSFSKNKKASSGLDNLACGSPATTRDSTGNTYVVWHAGPTGSRDIYFSRLTEGAANFGSSIQLTADSADQCNPAIAINGSDYLYVVWQDNRRGNWDIYMSNSADGINWSAENRVTDSNNNEVSPAIAVGSAGRAAVAWQDDRAGNQDIYLATSSDAFANKAVSQITSVVSDQTEPAITVDSGNTVYVVWTDRRNGSSDIYGAASNNGPWTNVPIVSNANNQSSPVIAVEAAGSTLHLLWVDSTPGNNDIFYATTNGLPSSPLVGSSIIDDSSGANQLEPAITITGSTGADLKVFACWQDWRNVGGSSRDTDIYFVELTSDGKTNVFVGDDGTNANQSEPAMAVDRYGYPYTVWSDSRATNPPIYYAGCTYMDPAPLAAQAVSASAGATVGVNPANIDSVDDVSVIVPAGACPCDVEITISRIMNPPEFVVQCLAAYDFGPSGMQFSQPVTVTIPYVISGTGTSATPYWFNSLTGALSQQGVTDIQDIVISPTLHALSFKTTHFTAFYLMSGSAGDAAAGGGGGGGCALSAAGEGNVVEFLLPYLALASVTLMLKLRDARNRRPHSTLNK
jgi:hypothetical protein